MAVCAAGRMYFINCCSWGWQYLCAFRADADGDGKGRCSLVPRRAFLLLTAVRHSTCSGCLCHIHDRGFVSLVFVSSCWIWYLIVCAFNCIWIILSLFRHTTSQLNLLFVLKCTTLCFVLHPGLFLDKTWSGSLFWWFPSFVTEKFQT